MAVEYQKVIKLNSDGQFQWAYTGINGDVADLAVDGEGYIYVASRDNKLHRINSNGIKKRNYKGLDESIRSLAIDKEGYLYLGAKGKIQKKSPKGAKKWTYEIGRSESATSLEVDKEGYLYAGTTFERIHKINSEGDKQWVKKLDYRSIRDLAVDYRGNIYLANRNQVNKKSTDGNKKWSYDEHETSIIGLAVDQNGYIYSFSIGRVYNDKPGEVHKKTPEGAKQWSYKTTQVTGFRRGAFSVSGSDFIYALSRSKVYKLNVSGEHQWSHSFQPQVENTLLDIEVGQNDYVYASSADGKVHKLSKAGKHKWTYDGQRGDVNGIAVNSNGYVYSASDNNDIHKISPEGKLVWTYKDLVEGVRNRSSFNDVAVNKKGYVFAVSGKKVRKKGQGIISLGRAHKISPDGKQKWTYEKEKEAFKSLKMDQNGDLLIGSTIKRKGVIPYPRPFSGSLHKLSADGKHKWSYTEPSYGVHDIATGKNGKIYLATGRKVRNTSPRRAVCRDGQPRIERPDYFAYGELLKITKDRDHVWSYDKHEYPIKGLSTDKNGNVYTASKDGAIHKVSIDAETIWKYTLHGGAVNSIATDGNGYLYSASEDQEIHKIRLK